MKILVECCDEKNSVDQEQECSTSYMPYLEVAKRPISVYRAAPRIPQAGDLSPGHLRHGHGEAIYLRGHTAPNRHIVRVVPQWALTGYTDIPQNAKPDLSHLPHYAIEEGSEQSHRLGAGVRGRVVSEHALSSDPRLSSENVVINREILNKTRRCPCCSRLERCQLCR
jgi:hypothetical protein